MLSTVQEKCIPALCNSTIAKHCAFIVMSVTQLKSMVKGQGSSCTHPRLSKQDSDTTDTTILYPFHQECTLDIMNIEHKILALCHWYYFLKKINV